MRQAPHISQEFNILTPEAAQKHAAVLLEQALIKIRAAISHCVSGVPEISCGRLAKPVRVGSTVFHIPLNPDAAAARSLDEELRAVFGSWPQGGLRRNEVGTTVIVQYPRLFAALYAWGYLNPEREWADVINWVREAPCTAGEAGERDILQVFKGFAHGEQAYGIVFQSDNQRLCFNPDYQGRVARVMADCMEVDPRELCRFERRKIVDALFQAHPRLVGLFPGPRSVLEAMVEVIQKGGSAA